MDISELLPRRLTDCQAEAGQGMTSRTCMIRNPDTASAVERYARERRAVDLIRTLPDPPGSLIRVLDLREDLATGFAYTMPLADPERARWTDDPGQYRPRTLRGEISARRARGAEHLIDNIRPTQYTWQHEDDHRYTRCTDGALPGGGRA